MKLIRKIPQRVESCDRTEGGHGPSGKCTRLACVVIACHWLAATTARCPGNFGAPCRGQWGAGHAGMTSRRPWRTQ
eukprot:14097440-Alexandrium_andersonii.AAC.1